MPFHKMLKVAVPLIFEYTETASAVAELLSKAMGYPYKILYFKKGGVLLPDGNWTGAIGLVNRSEVDIAVATFYMTEERNEAVSFSYPYEVGEITFVIKKAEEFSPDVFATFNLVSSSLWLTLAVSVIIMTIALFLFQGRRYSISDVAVLSITLSQASKLEHRTLGQYQLLLFWTVGMAFFVTCFKLILLSYLTIPPLTTVNDVLELAHAVEKGQYQCMTYKGSSFPHLLLNSSIRANRIIGDNILQNSMDKNSFQFFLEFSDTKTAYIGIRKSMNFLSNRYFISKDLFFPMLMALAAKKDFCCKENLNMAILKIVETGIYQKITNDFNFRNVLHTITHDNNESNWPRKLSMIDVQCVFTILILGYGIASVFLAIEILVYKSQNTVYCDKNKSFYVKRQKKTKNSDISKSPRCVDRHSTYVADTHLNIV